MTHRRNVLFTAILLLSGCRQAHQNAPESAPITGVAVSAHPATKTLQISVLCPTQPVELADAIKSGADSAVETMEANDGLKITVAWKPYRSQEELQDSLQSAIVAGDQAILLRPDPRYAMDSQLRQIAAAGVKVITLGIDVKKSLRAVFCGIPEEKLGTRLGYTIATHAVKPMNVGVIYDLNEGNLMRGLRDVAAHYPNLKLTEFLLKSANTDGVLATIHSHPERKSWVVFNGFALAHPEQMTSLDPKKVEIYTLGCWPRQLPMLESGLLKPLSLPSYELGYLAVCRAVDISAFHRKTEDIQMIATPLVEKRSVRTYALTLRRWGFADVGSRYLDTIRAGDSVR